MKEILLPALAMGAVGLVLGLLLALASKIFAVEKDERAEEIASVLPGANCGACGYSGCDGYARALSEGKICETNLCVPGGDTTSKEIASVLGVEAGETVKIGTGLSIAVPEGYFGAIFARSGLAAKEGLRPANCVGVADSDYRGEYIVALHNDSDVTRTVTPNERIAQLVIMPFLSVTFEEAQELDETERGAGGFGSTGK